MIAQINQIITEDIGLVDLRVIAAYRGDGFWLNGVELVKISGDQHVMFGVWCANVMMPVVLDKIMRGS